jgi:hypothetical protein
VGVWRARMACILHGMHATQRQCSPASHLVAVHHHLLHAAEALEHGAHRRLPKAERHAGEEQRGPIVLLTLPRPVLLDGDVAAERRPGSYRQGEHFEPSVALGALALAARHSPPPPLGLCVRLSFSLLLLRPQNYWQQPLRHHKLASPPPLRQVWMWMQSWNPTFQRPIAPAEWELYS